MAVLVGCAPFAAPQATDWAARFPDADTVAVAALAPGVRHAYLWLPAGPWAVHVVEIDERACAPDITAIKAGPPLAALDPGSRLGGTTIAAINADFFMSPGGTPVGAHVTGGRVLVGPGARPVYAIDRDGRHWAGPAELIGYVVTGPDSVALAQVNRPPAGGRHHPPRPGVALFDEWFGDTVPRTPARARLRVLDPGGPDSGLADGGAGVVVALDTEPPDTASAGRVALLAWGGEAEGWLQGLAPGDTVRWWARVVPAGLPDPEAGAGRGVAGAAVEAVGGFPMLVEDGRGVYAEQAGVIATFGPVRHPRTAVGWDGPRGRLFWVVVDGRQVPYSDGMSLPELEWLMLRLGATHAINLDGGGSTAMAVGGRLVNRPSDPTGERPVANVLALEGCRADGRRGGSGGRPWRTD